MIRITLQDEESSEKVHRNHWLKGQEPHCRLDEACRIIRPSVSAHSNDPLKFPAIPLAVGILSGFLTSEVARLLDPTNPFVGLVFGTGITLMVWLKHKSSFAWIAGALAATAVVAYFTAVWGTLTATALVARTIGLEKLFGEPVGADTFAVAGFLGALLINLALLLLLSPAKGLRLLGTAAAWACVGAFLGFLGSELSEPVGAAVATVVGPHRTDMGGHHHYLALYSAYLIWQPGMAFLIPLMLPHSSLPGANQAISIPRSPAELSIFGKLFFLCVFGALLVLGCLVARDLYHASNPHHQTDNWLLETPFAKHGNTWWYANSNC